MNRLMPVVYDELRGMARRYMRREQAEGSLQTTALVHEAYLKLVDARQVNWQDRAHFFALAARLMRRILVDHARARHRLKRGGASQRVSLDPGRHAAPADPSLAELDDALRALEAADPRKAQVVELRFFGGLSAQETAEVLGVSAGTVANDWKLAKVWLLRELEHTDGKHET